MITINVVMNLTNNSNPSFRTVLFPNPNPNMSPAEKISFSILSLLLIIVALSSNLFVIVSLLKQRSINVSHHLIINFCVANVTQCLLFFTTYTISVFSGFWHLGTWLCKVLPGLLNGYHHYAIAMLALLAKSRHNVIVRPLQNNQKKATIYIALACYWLCLVVTQAAITFFFLDVSEFKGKPRCAHFSAEDKDFQDHFFAAIGGFAIWGVCPHAHFLYHYIKIKRALRYNSENFGENNAGSFQIILRNKKATNTVLMSVLLFDVLIFPAYVLVSLAIFSQERFSSLVEWSELLLLCHCCANPVLFIWRNEQLKNTLKCFARKTRNSSVS